MLTAPSINLTLYIAQIRKLLSLLQLPRTPILNILPMILIQLRQPIVKVHWRIYLVIEFEVDGAGGRAIAQ